MLQQTISPPKKTRGTHLDRKQRQFTPAPLPPAGPPSTAIRSPFRTAAGSLQTSGGMRSEHIFDNKNSLHCSAASAHTCTSFRKQRPRMVSAFLVIGKRNALKNQEFRSVP